MNKLGFGVMAISVLAASAQATTLKLTGLGLGDSVTIYGPTTASVFAGQLNFQENNTSNLQLYCADLLHEINTGNSWSVNTFDTATQAAHIKAAGNIYAANYASATSNDKAAGLQLAIWEALYDGGSSADFTHGTFKVGASATAINFAQSYYSSLNTNGHATFYKVATPGYGQDQIGAVPEPASLAVLGVGVMALLRRRKKA